MGQWVVVCGPPGVGKSTVAQAVADRLDAAWLRTDRIRKDLFDDPTYSERETDAVYAELRDRAVTCDTASVVLDGTFRTRDRRGAVADLARQHGVGFRLVVVECDESVVRDRLDAREDDPSDADFEIYRKVAAQFRPPDRDHAVVDNSGSLDATRDRIAELF